MLRLKRKDYALKIFGFITLPILLADTCLGLTGSFSITIKTDRHLYQIGQDVYICGTLMYGGWPLQNRLVVTWVQNPNNYTFLPPTILQTDSEGKYNMSFKLPPQALLGTYTPNVSYACETGETITNSTTFKVVERFIVGDITGPDGWPDGKVDMRDMGLVATYFGQTVPPAPSNCDITGPLMGMPDGKIDMMDIGMVAKHFGETS